MHEVSVVMEMLNMVNELAKENGLEKVNKVVVKIGEFTCIDDDALKFAFEAIAKETICERGDLVIQKIKAKAYCPNCKKPYSVSYTDKHCPICYQYSNQIIAGFEMILDEIQGQ